MKRLKNPAKTHNAPIAFSRRPDTHARRELVAELLAAGKTQREIAETCGVSRRQVQKDIDIVLDAASRIDATALAKIRGEQIISRRAIANKYLAIALDPDHPDKWNAEKAVDRHLTAIANLVGLTSPAQIQAIVNATSSGPQRVEIEMIGMPSDWDERMAAAQASATESAAFAMKTAVEAPEPCVNDAAIDAEARAVSGELIEAPKEAVPERSAAELAGFHILDRK